MDSQLGDAYFDTRARLGSAIYGISKLAEEVELDPDRVTLLQNLLTGLKEPFLFVVVGEVNAGKSTLLNALFGQEFCESATVPMTSEICLFKYGSYEKDVCITDTLTELYRPNEFLKDFNIVDTPGTNSIIENHQEITERFIPMADLVIFTFSVVNPWGGTAWTLLNQIHTKWYKNIIFALQQCDLREQEEIDAIVEHMKVTAQQRLGTQFPIFAISGKKALLAKTTALDKERLWEESRYEPLEKHISSIVDSPQVREAKLGNVSRSARVILKEAQDKLTAGARILQADEELISGLDTDVAEQKSRTVDRINGLYRTLDNEFMSLSILGTRLFQDKLGLGGARGEGSPAQLEQRILDGMKKAGEKEVEDAAKAVESDLQILWRKLAEEMQEHFNFQLRVGTESGEPDWTPQHKHMGERLTATLNREIPALELGKLLNRRVAARRSAQLAFGLAIVGSIAGAAVLIGLNLVPPGKTILTGVCAAAIAVASVIFSGIYSQHTARTLVYALGDHFQAHRQTLNRAIEQDLGEEVNGFFDDFLQLFAPLHQLCEEHRLRYQPQITELDRLAEAFDEVDLLIGLESTPGGKTEAATATTPPPA